MNLYEAVKEWLNEHPELAWNFNSYNSEDDGLMGIWCTKCDIRIGLIGSDYLELFEDTGSGSYQWVEFQPTDPNFFNKLLIANAHTHPCEYLKTLKIGPDFNLAS